MYKLINENEIKEYDGKTLRRVITISNPTDEQLQDFGYMELIEGIIPDYDTETQEIKTIYSVDNGKIVPTYEIINK